MENSGCKVMLRDDKVEDLRRMYALFSRVPPTLEASQLVIYIHLSPNVCSFVYPNSQPPTPHIHPNHPQGLRASMAEFVRAAGRELVADQEQQKASGGGVDGWMGEISGLCVGQSRYDLYMGSRRPSSINDSNRSRSTS